MSEAEIQILIKATDEATAVLKDIKRNTEKTTDSFKEQTGQLLVLGNAAASVDRIFDSYQNLQLRLENAAERVANAQDRLIDAQTKLNKLTKAGKKGSEEYADAQRELDRATRGLTIAENNQARMQNAIVGTYISMGTQALTLAASWRQLRDAIVLTTKAGIAFIATPIGATLAAAAAYIGLVANAFLKYKKASEEAKQAQENMNQALTQALDKAALFNTALQKTKEYFSGLLGYQSKKELDLIAERDDLIVKMREDEAKGMIYSAAAKQAEIDRLNNLINIEEAKRQAYASTIAAEQRNSEIKRGIYTEEERLAKLPYEEQIKYIKENWEPTLASNYLWEKVQAIKNLDFQARIFEEAEKRKQKALITTIKIASILNPSLFLAAQQAEKLFKKFWAEQAANRQRILEAQMEDIGSGGLYGQNSGVTVNINAPIYGVSAGNISQALQKELNARYKI
jgi:hypothetical protein